MRRFTITTVALIALLLGACKPELTLRTESFLITPVPTGQPLANRPEVTEKVIAVMREKMAWTLSEPAYDVYTTASGEQTPSLSLYLVSSGVFDTQEIVLVNGERVLFDVVHAYQINHARQVIVIPVAIGMQTQSGGYVYFSSSYIVSVGADPDILTNISRESALKDAQERLPRAMVFDVYASGVTTKALDWSQCPATYRDIVPHQYCKAGAKIDRGYTALVTQRVATRLPEDWTLIGWYFSELPGLKDIDF